jgi:DNA replication and repair protein RecF
MYLETLELTNYRNYGGATFKFSPAVNIIVGGNAQGKTNILEAVYYLSAGNSHRAGSDIQLVKQGESMASIRSTLDRGGNKLSLEVFLAPGDKKRIKVGGVEKYRFSDLLGHLHAVIFSPEDLQIVKGGPERRRAFIDDTIVQISPTYHYWRRKYDRVLRQRNILLKTMSRDCPMESLELWDRHLAEVGTKVIVNRLAVIERLAKFAADAHKKITKGGEKLEISYISRVAEGGVEGPEEIERRFVKELIRRRKEEIDRKVTLVGPHRDDLIMNVNGDDIKLFGSQGQQRTVALSLKFAQMRLIEQEVKAKPLLLLDDVMSELDEDRQAYLMNMVKTGSQVLITATHLDSFASQDIGKHTVLRIKSGSVVDKG